MTISNDDPRLRELADLLRRREAIIADHGLRDRDPEAQLDALRAVSEEITHAHRGLSASLPPRLEHFMAGCSYQKALAFLEKIVGE